MWFCYNLFFIINLGLLWFRVIVFGWYVWILIVFVFVFVVVLISLSVLLILLLWFFESLVIV